MGVGTASSARKDVRQHRAPYAISAIAGLFTAHFLGAFNDNIYKMVIALLAVHTAGSAAGGGSQLSLVGAVFVLPFLLFSGYAGHVADVYSKRAVLVVTKACEIVVMGLGLLALLSGQSALMLAVLFLLALQATFFSPAKYSILPELVADTALSRANGFLEMSGFLAIILGTSLGGMMFAAWQHQLGILGGDLDRDRCWWHRCRPHTAPRPSFRGDQNLPAQPMGGNSLWPHAALE